MLSHIASLLVKFFGALVSYLLTLYLSKTFGNEKLGYFSFFLSYSLIYLLVLKFGTDLFLMRATSKFHAEEKKGKAKFLYKKLLAYHILSGSLITGAGILITPLIFESFFTSYKDTGFFEIALLSVFFGNLHILNYEFLRGSQKVISYTFYHTVIIFLLTILFNLTLDILTDEMPRQLEYAYLAAVVASFLISTAHVYRILRTYQTEKIESFSLRKVLSGSFPFFSNNTIFVLIGTLDIFILSKFISPTAIGEYTLIVKIATFVSFPLIVLSSNFSPRIPTYNSPERLGTAIMRFTRWISLGASLIFILTFLLLPYLSSYLELDPAASRWIFLIIGAGHLFSSACAMNEVTLLMLGEEKLYQKIMLFACLFNFILNLLLIPVWKETGAAITSLSTIILWNLVAVYYAKKKLKLSTSLIVRI